MTAIAMSTVLYRVFLPHLGRVTGLLERYGAPLWDLEIGRAHV